jgi:hypothetical protein
MVNAGAIAMVPAKAAEILGRSARGMRQGNGERGAAARGDAFGAIVKSESRVKKFCKIAAKTGRGPPRRGKNETRSIW